MIDKLPITREGLEKLRRELHNFITFERPKNIKAIEDARSHGDLSENAEYHAAKERQSFLEAKINELETAINRSEVIEIDKGQTEKIFFGKTVELENIVRSAYEHQAHYILHKHLELKGDQKNIFIEKLKDFYPDLVNKYKKLYKNSHMPNYDYILSLNKNMDKLCKKFKLKNKI